ncbi:hypothetical protein KKH3_22760 [Pectobacterium actinidiae]|nr:hypothetical protein KKH3_22760 [Pectobacterium actinidiae]
MRLATFQPLKAPRCVSGEVIRRNHRILNGIFAVDFDDKNPIVSMVMRKILNKVLYR